MQSQPRKLKNDAIVEAILEVRFEHAELPEVAFARLVDLPRWADFSTTRLAAANLPPEIRAQDQNLFFQPSAQLDSSNGQISARIGPNVISVHCVRKYPGWDTGFFDLIKSMLDDFNIALPSASITRLGLRYLNIFTSSKHGISSPADLNIKLNSGGRDLQKSFHLNYSQVVDGKFDVRTQIASVDVIQGNIPADGSVLLDIDVTTPPSLGKVSKSELVSWIEKAHQVEKDVFFSVLPKDKIEDLREA